MATLFIPTALRSFTDRKNPLTLPGGTVSELMNALADEYPDIKQHLFDDQGSLRPFINVFVGDTNVRSLQGLETPVTADSSVMLVPAIAGGAGR